MARGSRGSRGFAFLDKIGLIGRRLFRAFEGWLPWYVAGSVFLLIAPELVVFRLAPWQLHRSEAYQLLGLSICFFLTALIGWMWMTPGDSRRPWVAVAISSTVMALFMAGAALLSGAGPLLSVAALIYATLALIPWLLSRWPRILTASLGAMLVVGIVGAVVASTKPLLARPSQASLRRTALYTLRLQSYSPFDGLDGAAAIAPWGDGFIMAARDGALFGLGFSDRGASGRRLPIRVPLNRDEFVADAPPDVNRGRFRVSGILTERVEGGTRLLVSYHHWNAVEHCLVMRLAWTMLPEDRADAPAIAEWNQLYETHPCLPVSSAFAGHQAGGRILRMGDEPAVLWTVGDHGFDGVGAADVLPQSLDADYGKTLLVPLDGTPARHYTIGHRNPQGLTQGSDGRIWSTEHGPQGGDELNELVDGHNYGWPWRTLGTNYDDVVWPLLREPTNTESFHDPSFAWLPSVGLSNLIALRGTLFDRWSNDLLVASLAGMQLFRVRLSGARVEYTEAISIGCRIRDLIEAPSGTVLILCDEGEVKSLDPLPDIAIPDQAGQCLECHSITGKPAIGPSLLGVVGRPVGSEEDYEYSSALTALGGRWTPSRLDAFLENPAAFAPGTRMTDRVLDAADRELLIEFLKTLKPVESTP